MPEKVVSIDTDNPDARVLRRAAALINRGEVLVCPTDTGYAFAANALDDKAIVKVFNLKGRSSDNPIHVAVGSLREADRYAVVNRSARVLARNFLPGALTLVLPRKSTVPPLLVAGRDTLGIRVPDDKVILKLVRLGKVPVTATSANLSGDPTPYNVPDIIVRMGKNMEKVALVLDRGEIRPPGLSTIVDLTAYPPRLIRQGRIPWAEICAILGVKGD